MVSVHGVCLSMAMCFGAPAALLLKQLVMLTDRSSVSMDEFSMDRSSMSSTLVWCTAWHMYAPTTLQHNAVPTPDDICCKVGICVGSHPNVVANAPCLCSSLLPQLHCSCQLIRCDTKRDQQQAQEHVADLTLIVNSTCAVVMAAILQQYKTFVRKHPSLVQNAERLLHWLVWTPERFSGSE